MKSKKISEDVSVQLTDAAQEALQKIDPFNQLMNAGVEYEQEEKPKRKRRTKAEMQAAEEEKKTVKREEEPIIQSMGPSHILATVEWDIDKDDDTVIPSKVAIPDDVLVDDYDIETVSDYLTKTTGYCHNGFTLSWPDSHENREQFCQWEIEKAHLEGKTEPDFDFRRFYQEGDRVYLVRYYDTLKTKDLIFMTIRTIYPRMMVGVVEKQYCQCVGMSDKDNIFYNKKDALDYFNSIQANVEAEYNEETGKKKRKRKAKVNDDEDMEEFFDEQTFNEEEEQEEE